MKRTVLLATVLAFFHLGTSAQFTDAFTDGDEHQNPQWVGDTAKYKVNGLLELQLDDVSNSSPGVLATRSQAIRNASWECYFRLDFAPSTSNYAKVYITSNTEQLGGSVNGYFVKIGGASGTVDDISLYKQSGSTETRLIDGRDGTVGGSSPEGKIRVTRDAVGNWELFVDTSATLSGYISEGTIQDGDFVNPQFFGFYSKYTSTRSDKFFFDDIVVTGTAYPDTTKPTIQNLIVQSATEVEVHFSELLDPTTALNASHFILNGSTNPSSITFAGIDSSAVNLTFSAPFANGVSQQLVVSTVEDRSGNAMNSETRQFFYGVPDSVEIGDVYINEFMPDPNPVVALPDAEFVEIYNVSNKLLHTTGWSFADASSSVTLPGAFIQPNETVILCERADSADFAAFGRVLAVSSLPAINNTGDYLGLSDSAGTVLDEVQYTSSFYRDQSKAGGGVSLELIHPGHPCATGASNWKGSESIDGGTPGQMNSVFDTTADNTPPAISHVEVLSDSTIKVVFNEVIDTAFAKQANYTFWFDMVSTARLDSVWPDAVFLYVGGVAYGVEYTVGIDSVKDCIGNLAIGLSERFYQPVAPTTVFRITEIHPMPSEDLGTLPNAEYIELLNRSQTSYFSLDGMELRDATSTGVVNGGVVPPGGYVILCKNSAVADFAPYGNVVGVSSFPSLNNTGDVIGIYYNGEKLDEVTYSDDWYDTEEAKEGGVSLELKDWRYYCPSDDNWEQSSSPAGGTPGVANSYKKFIDNEVPRITGVSVLSRQKLRINFSEYSSLKDVSIEPLLEVDSIINYNTYAEVLLKQLIQPKVMYTLTAIELKDCSENTTSESAVIFGLPEKAAEGDVLINELLFNPLNSSGSDYIEIYNTSDKVIELSGWYFSSYDTDEDTLENFAPLAMESLQMLPESFLVFMTDSDDVLSVYPKHNSATFVEVSSLPGWANDEGTAVLIDTAGEVMERFDYNDDMHFGLLNDVDGVSLERIHLTEPASEVSNWHSAAEGVGFGTPGLPNSTVNQSEDEGAGLFIVTPERFSPDGDGFEDLLYMEYNLPSLGYVGTLTIYDAKGRHIKQVMDNELLSESGNITWDGIDEDGRKARVGIYIAVFEAYNDQGEVILEKRPFALAAIMH